MRKLKQNVSQWGLTAPKCQWMSYYMTNQCICPLGSDLPLYGFLIFLVQDIFDILDKTLKYGMHFSECHAVFDEGKANALQVVFACSEPWWETCIQTCVLFILIVGRIYLALSPDPYSYAYVHPFLSTSLTSSYHRFHKMLKHHCIVQLLQILHLHLHAVNLPLCRTATVCFFFSHYSENILQTVVCEHAQASLPVTNNHASVTFYPTFIYLTWVLTETIGLCLYDFRF